jgi:murein DD-endopeptidase MepM/ murein hydrolase activator NlpD
MTSLAPERLTTETAATAEDARSTRQQDSGTSSRTAAASASMTAAGTSPAKAARTAKAAARTATATAKVARTATVTAARSASATARAAGAKAAAVRTTAVARRAAAARKAAASSTATPGNATAEPATPEITIDEAPAPVVEPAPAPAAVAPSEDAVVDDVAVPAEAEESGSPRPSRRRRPAFYVAAALVGALSITAATVGETTAVAETSAVSESMSVAEALGVEAEVAEPIVRAETTDKLGDLVASRAQRDEEQVHAARLQAEADEEAREDAARAAKAAAEAARPKAVRPVKGARLTSGFGPRWGTLHGGIDLAGPIGTPEYAAMDGVVLEAGPASGFGLAVYIQHGNGDVTVYGHMNEILVTAGQVVKAGDTIALLGNQGQSTGPHLHFEVYEGGLDGTKIDPIPWLAARGVKV